jgi:hypothetical protein
MKFHHVPAPAGQPATRLWVMLPGAYMKPTDFISAGFVEALRERRLPHSVALLEAGIPELADGSAQATLHQFLQDQTIDGACRVSLLGISLGAHLALACLARSLARPADAVLLLAPYLGPRDVLAQVARAQTVAEIEQSIATRPDLDLEIWRWLRQPPADAPQIFLGYGSGDRFAAAHALLARTPAPHHVDVQPGGHDWPVWAALWTRHLDQFHAH